MKYFIFEVSDFILLRGQRHSPSKGQDDNPSLLHLHIMAAGSTLTFLLIKEKEGESSTPKENSQPGLSASVLISSQLEKNNFIAKDKSSEKK